MLDFYRESRHFNNHARCQTLLISYQQAFKKMQALNHAYVD